MDNATSAPTPVKRPVVIPSSNGEPWTIQDSTELYQIEGWGQGYFAINDAGHVVARPHRSADGEIDLHEVIMALRERRLKTPIVLSFCDLLDHRIAELHDAFACAIRDNGYKGQYRAVYPIKVNQMRHLVEQIQGYGEKFDYGLEVGSKPELLAVLGVTASSPNQLIICNGFKEDRYIDMVTLATKLGRRIIPVIENLDEFQLIIKHTRRHDVRPTIGLRANLATEGAGRWRHSSGVKAKFGLSISEVLEVFKWLKSRNMEDCLQLLHCHLGSQIHDIRSVNSGVNELTRVYVELVKMGAGLKYLDIGGGLGVDYDGSQTNFEFSTNYTLPEYASNVVYRVMSVCDEAKIPHPTIVTESGRAMVAHQSVLIFDVIGANSLDRYTVPGELDALGAPGAATPRSIVDLLEAYHNVSEDRLLECYHDALQARDEAINLFNVGHLRLDHRALIDRLFWATCAKIRDLCRELEIVPEELLSLESTLSDTYFCNLSIFQSLPDIWAIDQIFPVMPIHRLGERPTRLAALADLTCDSDGRIDRFIGKGEVKHTLELHPLEEGEQYLMGAFLVGAYQETLGDLHNLFGDTHVVNIRLDEAGRWVIDSVVEGDTVREVLQHVHYDVAKLHDEIRRECERAVRSNQLTVAQSQELLQAYESALAGSTYLE